jgi:RND family efflux transporter MFP subunit
MAVGGRPLLVVTRSNPVRIFVDVPEMDAPYTNAGDPATVRVQALADKVVDARVTRTAVGLDQGARTLRTEIDLDNASGELRPGLYAYVSLLVEERVDVLAVPASAVLSAEGKAFCYVVERGTVVNKPVRLGLRAGSEVQILEGLTGDERVIAKNAAAFAPGQLVEILPPEEAP